MTWDVDVLIFTGAQYLITGGEDDLVLVWSFVEKCPVAR